jgi:peptidoglycan/LPS O-acetylase OafA/YrhL
MTATATTRPTAPKTRDRYLDVLRALALVRVITYHAFPVAWLTYLPAMGVMFALGGSLMAASLERSGMRAVGSRLRRLLPSLWVLGLLVVPVMIWQGWGAHSGDATPRRWWELTFWVLPLGDPPGNDWAEASWGGLWYLKAYLWFVLLSPLALRAFRKVPLVVLMIPIVVLIALETGVLDLSGQPGSALADTATFGACWLLGFAHHDGVLSRIRVRTCLLLAAVAMAAGVGWMLVFGDESGSRDLDLSAPGLALYSVGTVFLLLRFRPDLSWLARWPVLDRVVTIVNARALTIYLWHNVALTLALALGDRLGLWQGWQWFALGGVLLLLFVLALGWVEDLSARRRPRLLPGVRARPRAPAPAGS